MLITIGILIIILLIVVIFYQNLISEKVKVEDAQENLKYYLKQEYNADAENIQEKMAEWKQGGLKLDKQGKYLFDYMAYREAKYQAKLKQFPYSVMKDLFKVKDL